MIERDPNRLELVREHAYSDHVRFLPWVGASYEKAPWGHRTLIVGESHYGTRAESTDREFSRKLLRRVADGTWSHRFFRNTERLFDGVPAIGPSSPEVATPRFWDAVSFYNYLPTMLTAPKDRPSTEGWSKAREPFQEIIQVLRPQVVLFVCKRVFLAVAAGAVPAPPLATNAGTRDAIWLKHVDGGALGSYVLHPSYRGYRKQRAWVDALLHARGSGLP